MKFENVKFRALPFLAALFITTIISAQDVTITGTVIDAATNETLIGATIVIKGTTRGTITNLDGYYTIDASVGETLVFSSIGYVTVEQAIGDATVMDVSLSVSFEELEEVIVVGYGSVRKKDVTGSVTSVKTEDFNRGPQNSPADLLQGKSAGVMITNSSGDPGANSTIRIRGNSSVRAGNDPLIVVDGVPIIGGTTQDNSSIGAIGDISARNPLNFINPNDIAAMDILKDASATAIYGSRGANGVIIITTKQGAAGDNVVEYNTNISTASIARNIKLYAADEFRTVVDPTFDLGANVDAMDEILRRSWSHQHNLAMRGGNQNLKYRLSLGYQNTEGIVKNSGMEKLTANLNASQKLFDGKLRLSANLVTSTVDDQFAPGLSTNAGFEYSLVGAALVWNPTRDFYLPDGSFNQWSVSDGNPLAMLEYISDEASTLRLLSNFGATLQLAKGLEYRFNLGIDRYTSERATEVSNEFFRDKITDRGYARLSNRLGSSLLLEHYLTYQTVFADIHRLNAMAGYSYQYFDRTGNFIEGRDFVYNQVPYINQLQAISQAERNVSSFQDPRTELQSFFGRVNLNLWERLLFTGTIRADGSSKFGANNKYGYFPSFALAYRISQEAFMPDIFDDLKIRLGWGQTGNEAFPAGASQAQYEITRDGITRSQYDNPDLKWETSTSINAAIDFVILNNKVTGTVEYFNKGTEDLLFNAEAALPGPSGVRRWTNLDASVVNSGVEFSLNWLAVQTSDITFSVGANASFIKNMLKDFAGVVETGGLHGQGMTGTTVQRFVADQPLNVYYTLDFLGLDGSGLGIYSPQKLYFGDPNPKTILGFNLNFKYRGFDAIANLNGAYGHYVYNNTGTSVLVANNLAKGRNVSPDYVLDGEDPANAIKASSRYLEKGNYLRLNNLAFGYSFPEAPWVFRSLRLSLTVQNVFVITDFTGFDPEVNVDKNIDGVPSYGIEYTPYPNARTFTFGLNVSF